MKNKVPLDHHVMNGDEYLYQPVPLISGNIAERKTLHRIPLKKRKIRGHKRIHRVIEKWTMQHTDFDLAAYLKHKSNRCYVKITIAPWCNLSLKNSFIPEPKGLTRRKMLEGLVAIYHHWNEQLAKTGEPYYLKMWLYDRQFSKSQVVAAVGDKLHFYENAFSIPSASKPISLQQYAPMAEQLRQFHWEYCTDDSAFGTGQPAGVWLGSLR